VSLGEHFGRSGTLSRAWRPSIVLALCSGIGTRLPVHLILTRAEGARQRLSVTCEYGRNTHTHIYIYIYIYIYISLQLHEEVTPAKFQL